MVYAELCRRNWVASRSSLSVLLCLAISQTLGATASLIAFGDSISDVGQGANVAVHAALGLTQVAGSFVS